ncbi:aldose epimerase family protein [Periweissella ghanensis]|uniref:Maltose epimerase n=1 Tax=Periweissella ghanensis TaxID=467997 RepID=A0ABN8BMI4_9LACO|nr:aldose epimerase family protein [Periweissella ghanensis]MCM0600468.1 galactose mutarotase [Periweissella ghanensis]CAH0418066.1 Maltose epimerase [Periweissella ghanensis]
MTVTSEEYGQYNGEVIYRYTIENQHQTRLRILSYAGIIQEFSVNDVGQRINLVLSFDDLAGFTENGYNFNRVIGRHAGRIGQAQWTGVNGVITVPANEKGNSLHGGPQGIGNQVFTGQIDTLNEAVSLNYQAKEAIDGYPGDLAVNIKYQLTNDDQVIITLSGTQTGAPGIFNPTVHTYFNLSDPAVTDVTQMSLQVASESRLVLNDDKVPTGEIVPVVNALYDFTDITNLGERLENFKAMTVEKGLDDAFVVAGDLNTPAATLIDDASQRQINVYSDRNGIILYTANDLNDAQMALNRGTGHPYEGLAIEAQNLPDAVNHPDFGDITIQPDETKSYQIIYQYDHR